MKTQWTALTSALVTAAVTMNSASLMAKPAFSAEAIEKAGTNKPALAFRLQPPVELPMRLTKTQWSEEDESRFGSFVKRIADAVTAGKCNTVQSCLKNKEANPYASSDPKSLVFYADCGIFPFLMRAYFSFKNGLPFSVAKTTAINQQPQSSAPNSALDDLLTTSEPESAPYGNAFTGRDSLPSAQAPGSERNFQLFMGDLVDFVSTRFYRVGPLSPHHDLSDLYPVPLNRQGIRSGSVIYTTGHVYMVSSVDESGLIHVLDAHPDNSLSSRKTIDASKLERSRPDQGLGFYRFRASKLVNARAVGGAFYGGMEVRPTDFELFEKGLLSMEQYFGPGTNVVPGSKVDPQAWKKGFAHVDFFALLETRLRDRNLKTDAVADVAVMFEGLCTELQQRMTDVDVAVNAENHVHRLDHPSELPANIFSTSEMTWETFSSPSRDGRVRAGALNIIKLAIQKYRTTLTPNAPVFFAGSAKDYQKALLRQLSAVNQRCQLGYVNSRGDKVSLTMQQVLARLYAISFDPYHCPERRWGATGAELQTCSDRDVNGEWYRAEQVMRNTIGKTSDGELLVVRSARPVTLEMLKDPRSADQPSTSDVNLGTTRRAKLNLFEVLASDEFAQRLQ